jgi:hypothetical protein
VTYVILLLNRVNKNNFFCFGIAWEIFLVITRSTSKLDKYLPLIFHSSRIKSKPICIRINCDKADSFGSVWEKAIDDLNVIETNIGIGFIPQSWQSMISVQTFLPKENLSSNDVCKALSILSDSFLPVVIIDKFNRISEKDKPLFADLIKNLSDHSFFDTIIIIGVG